MAVNLSPLGGVGAQFFDSNGNPLSGGLIYTYAAGTNTPQATYTTSAGTIQHSNPIVLDAAGRVPTGEIWLTDGVSYKFVIQTSAAVLVGTYDNIVGINSNFIAYTAQQEIQTATAGQTVFTLNTIQYQPNTNNLAVYVDGVNQYGPGAMYAFVETDSTTVTFVSGLHVGASVKFTTASPVSSSSTDAQNVSYEPPFTGSVGTTVADKLAQYVSILDFGADPSGATDSTTAIQNALDYCEINGVQIYGNPGTYLITSTIVIKCSGDMSAMTLNADATLLSTAVRVGPNAAGQYLFDVDLKLPFVNNTAKSGAGWTGFSTSIGVEIANVYQSRIVATSIYNFGVGLSCGGYDVGCVYNTITIGVLFGNKINLELLPKTTGGWCNQNTFIGGRYGYSSAEGTVVSGVRQISITSPVGATVGAPNNNVWLNPSIEGNEPEYHLYIQGAFNAFIAPRFEVGTGIAARVQFYAASVGETTSNYIEGGYDAGGIYYGFSGAGTWPGNTRWGSSKTGDALEFSGNGVNIVNKSGNAVANPHIQGFLASQISIAKTETSTDWIYRLHGDGLSIKSSTDTYPRISANASGYIYFGRGSASPTAGFRAGVFGEVNAQSTIQPESDGVYNLGSATNRWATVYATTGTINTSDANAKEEIVDLSDAEKRVALKIKTQIKRFKFKTGNRKHFGVIAQEVKSAFEDENLIAEDYGLFCSDILEDGTTRLGIRYDELFAFIIGAL